MRPKSRPTKQNLSLSLSFCLGSTAMSGCGTGATQVFALSLGARSGYWSYRRYCSRKLHSESAMSLLQLSRAMALSMKRV